MVLMGCFMIWLNDCFEDLSVCLVDGVCGVDNCMSCLNLLCIFNLYVREVAILWARSSCEPVTR